MELFFVGVWGTLSFISGEFCDSSIWTDNIEILFSTSVGVGAFLSRRRELFAETNKALLIIVLFIGNAEITTKYLINLKFFLLTQHLRKACFPGYLCRKSFGSNWLKWVSTRSVNNLYKYTAAKPSWSMDHTSRQGLTPTHHTKGQARHIQSVWAVGLPTTYKEDKHMSISVMRSQNRRR